jgi:hypothetical protein
MAPRPVLENRKWVPSGLIEFGYYLFLLFSFISVILAISIPLQGFALLALLAAACIIPLGGRALTVYRPIKYQVACVLTSIAIQLAFHGDIDGVRPFVNWFLGLLVIHALVLREGFLNRFAVVAFVAGLTTLPYLNPHGEGDRMEVARMGVEGTALSNPNNLGMWFGFCCVYFFVAGSESKKNITRAIWWLLSFGSLLVVGLTVSRGPLVAVAIAGVIASRRLFKRGFVPVLCLLVIGWGFLVSGLFDNIITFYLDRGMEDTGRFRLWQNAIVNITDSPWVGAGASAARVPYTRGYITPHNGFLYITMASGIVPLLLFSAYWLIAGRMALRANIHISRTAAFHLPLFAFAFLEMFILSAVFMSHWHMVVVSSVMSVYSARPLPRAALKRVQRRPLSLVTSSGP